MPREKDKEREVWKVWRREQKQDGEKEAHGEEEKWCVCVCTRVGARAPYFAISSSKATCCLQHIWDWKWKLKSSFCSSIPLNTFCWFFFFSFLLGLTLSCLQKHADRRSLHVSHHLLCFKIKFKKKKSKNLILITIYFERKKRPRPSIQNTPDIKEVKT